MDREQCAPRGLLNADDSIVLLIDLQQPFLKKMEAEECARVVDHCRFVVEVAQRFDVPVVTTVEQPQKKRCHGGGGARLL
ncbi:MAG: hypothetical protein M0D54_01620 [Hyphomonadaceae bacterium JAD_PAG50586_4]|nr:MAG: hypothetical protein M0D54_01620 [Hyphomonadaceae bacterium JAD_PAG50586_4]